MRIPVRIARMRSMEQSAGLYHAAAGLTGMSMKGLRPEMRIPVRIARMRSMEQSAGLYHAPAGLTGMSMKGCGPECEFL